MDILPLNMKEISRLCVMEKLVSKSLTEEEARKLMNLKSVRQVRRIKKAYIKEGAKGLVHKNRGKPGNRKFTDEYISKILDIYQGEYHDFKPTFASEKLMESHNMIINRESLRQLLINNNLWKPKPRRNSKKRHVWRERRNNYGEMQQFDGSYHHWFEDRADECCLLLSVDDAAGAITKAKFDQHEGVIPVFNFWREYGEKNGFPCEIYLDKFSTYKINHKCAQDNSELMTQFGRAMSQIGVKLISAHSPEAKGRVERMNKTLQDRLVKELRLKNINNIEDANKFLEEEFIPKFNAKFAVVPKGKADLHKPVNKELRKKLPQIFSMQYTRKVMNDYTVMFKNKYFQLDEKQPITVFKKDTVVIEEHLNGSIKINLKDKYLKYRELPKRPEKIIDVPVCALTKNKAPWMPAKDHPWRGNKYLNNSKTLITSRC